MQSAPYVDIIAKPCSVQWIKYYVGHGRVYSSVRRCLLVCPIVQVASQRNQANTFLDV